MWWWWTIRTVWIRPNRMPKGVDWKVWLVDMLKRKVPGEIWMFPGNVENNTRRGPCGRVRAGREIQDPLRA